MNKKVFTGGQVVLPDSVVTASLVVEGETIAGLLLPGRRFLLRLPPDFLLFHDVAVEWFAVRFHGRERSCAPQSSGGFQYRRLH